MSGNNVCVGDLVRVNQNIREYVEESGQTSGVVIGIFDPESNPLLASILWPDGQVESLYADEIEIIGRKSESR